VTDPNDTTPAAELRLLVQDMLEVSSDGRRMAAELSRTIKEIVAVQCDAIDERARQILARAEALSSVRER
jgi:hypothetical protein